MIFIRLGVSKKKNRKQMKKYVVFFSAINAGAIYLILHYAGTNKWTILSLFIGAELLAWYFFVRNNKNYN